MNIAIIHGLSSQRGEKRLKLLVEKIKKELPEAKIIVPNYLEKYQKPVIFTAGKKSILEYAKICKAVIEREKSPGSIIIIGYSLGGLITRVLVEKLKVNAKAIILIGTPNKGVKLNRWEKLLSKILKRPVVEEILPYSQFLNVLNQNYGKLTLQTRYYLLAGSEDKRVPPTSALGIEFIKSSGTFIGISDHSGLIPQRSRSGTAIDIIIQILKEEAGFSLPPSFFY